MAGNKSSSSSGEDPQTPRDTVAPDYAALLAEVQKSNALLLAMREQERSTRDVLDARLIEVRDEISGLHQSLQKATEITVDTMREGMDGLSQALRDITTVHVENTKNILEVIVLAREQSAPAAIVPAAVATVPAVVTAGVRTNAIVANHPAAMPVTAAALTRANQRNPNRTPRKEVAVVAVAPPVVILDRPTMVERMFASFDRSTSLHHDLLRWHNEGRSEAHFQKIGVAALESIDRTHPLYSELYNHLYPPTAVTGS